MAILKMINLFSSYYLEVDPVQPISNVHSNCYFLLVTHLHACLECEVGETLAFVLPVGGVFTEL